MLMGQAHKELELFNSLAAQCSLLKGSIVCALLITAANL